MEEIPEHVKATLDGIIDRSLGMACARCRNRTGNNTQGHYWSYCARVRGTRFLDGKKQFHFCCPDDCELGDRREGERIVSRF